MRFECVSRTHVGLKRQINEDSLLADTDAAAIGPSERR
jgi:hypothetical protein